MTYIFFQNTPGFLDGTIPQIPPGLAVIPIGTRDLPFSPATVIVPARSHYIAQAVLELLTLCRVLGGRWVPPCTIHPEYLLLLFLLLPQPP